MNEISGIAVDMAQFVAQHKNQILYKAYIAYSIPFLMGLTGLIYYGFFRFTGGVIGAIKRGHPAGPLIVVFGVSGVVLMIGAAGLINVILFPEMYIAEHIARMVR